MKYTYSISKDDFLTFQLFQLSQTSSFNYKLLIQQVIVTLINFGISVYFFANKDYYFFATFFALGTLWYFLYPFRIKRMYKKKYEMEMGNKFDKHFDLQAQFEITPTTMKTSYGKESSEKDFAYIKEVVFLKDAMYIIFKNRQTFIFPKRRTENFEQLADELRTQAKASKLVVRDLPKWKW